MKNRLTAIICCVLTILGVLLAPPAGAQSDTADAVEPLLGGIIAFKQAECGAQDIQGWIDRSLADEAGVSSETYILALHQTGIVYDYSAYSRSLLGYLEQEDVTNPVSRQKYALSLMAANCRNDYIRQTANDSIGQLGVMSWVYGLHLLNNGAQCADITEHDAVSALLELRLADGGWAVSGEVSDVDVTAMALQALAAHRGSGEVEAAVQEALAFLSASQLDSGAFASYGVECAESTAQVIITLCSLGIDCREDARFIKNDHSLLDGLVQFRLEDGSFAHTVNGTYSHMATSQTFAAMVAMQRLTVGTGSLFMLDNQPDNTVEYIGGTENRTGGWRLWACLAVTIAAVMLCAVLYFTGRRLGRNFIVTAAAACAALILIFTLDIQKPSDYYGKQVSKTDVIGTVTITIRCNTIAGTVDLPYIPEDGIILDVTQMLLSEGDTVYDILTDAVREHSIHMESEDSAGGSYVAGINHIYELEHGQLSGWIYRVNEEMPPVGCSAYVLSNGDTIEWLYSCDIGNDLA